MIETGFVVNGGDGGCAVAGDGRRNVGSWGEADEFKCLNGGGCVSGEGEDEMHEDQEEVGEPLRLIYKLATFCRV